MRDLPYRLGFSQARMTARISLDSVEAGVALGLAWLFETGAASRLRQCDECGRYFLVEGKAHSARYCSHECRGKANAEAAAERQRRYRERKKKGDR